MKESYVLLHHNSFVLQSEIYITSSLPSNHMELTSAELQNTPGHVQPLCSTLSMNKLKGQGISLHVKQAEGQPDPIKDSAKIY